eukprot:6488151-Heterocapsa_arctica.AAC.1
MLGNFNNANKFYDFHEFVETYFNIVYNIVNSFNIVDNNVNSFNIVDNNSNIIADSALFIVPMLHIAEQTPNAAVVLITVQNYAEDYPNDNQGSCADIFIARDTFIAHDKFICSLFWLKREDGGDGNKLEPHSTSGCR